MKNLNEASKASADDLEFPDWSGMLDTGLNVDPATAFRLCEKYYAKLPDATKQALLERRKDCPVEFIL